MKRNTYLWLKRMCQFLVPSMLPATAEHFTTAALSRNGKVSVNTQLG